MKKNTLFAAALIAMLVAILTSCYKDNVFEQDVKIGEESTPDTSSVNAVAPVRYVTLGEARQQLENILSEMDLSISKSGRVRRISSAFTLSSDVRTLKKSSSEDETEDVCVHVFNFEDEGGVAFMSATTATPPLLALTEDGCIDTTKEIDNPGMIFFLERLEDYLTDVNNTLVDYDTSVSLSKKFIQTEVFDFYAPKNGYCKVHWGQESPYNMYCTYSKKIYGDTRTGCTATALTQFLSVMKYPKAYKGYSFDWDKMIEGKNDDKVARMMQLVGTSENIEASYGDLSKNEGTGGDFDNIPRTLKNLGFSSGGSISDYNTSKIISELKQGNCVLISGYAHIKKPALYVCGIRVRKTTYKSGHTWLIHGGFTLTTKIYSSHSPAGKKYRNSVDSYVLCNFGWDGTADGYYWSGVFDTNDGPDFDEAYYPTKLSKNYEKDYWYQYKLEMLTGYER